MNLSPVPLVPQVHSASPSSPAAEESRTLEAASSRGQLRVVHLLWLYLPLPAALAWLAWRLCDSQTTLATGEATYRPSQWVVYTLAFGMPHVMASFFCFAEPTLRRACRSVLWRAMVLAAAVTMAMDLLLDTQWQSIVATAWTLVHVMGQQTGLALAQARLTRGPASTRALGSLWRWLLGIAAATAALGVGGEALSGPLLPYQPSLMASGVLLAVTTPLAGLLGWLAHREGGDVRGVLAIQASASAAYALVCVGDAWMGVMLLRWTHDATAFTLYGALAIARERKAPGRNPLWAPLSWLRLPPRAKSWAMAICIWPMGAAAALLLVLAPSLVPLWLALTHYAAEGGLWRRGSPLRQSLPLS